MNERSSRRTLVVVAVVVAALGLWWLFVYGPRTRSAGEVEPRSAHASASATPEDLAAPPRIPATGADAGSERAEDAPLPARIVCRRRDDGSLLAGVSVFSGATTLAGPSAEDGVLELHRGRAQALTIWSEGWSPVAVRKFDPTPEVVLLDACSGRLEVHLTGMVQGDEVVRSLVQPRGYHVTEGDPWAPVLSPAGPDRLAVGSLPAGEFDVYVWVAQRPAAARPLGASAVVVPAEGTVVVELAADVLPEPEPDR